MYEGKEKRVHFLVEKLKKTDYL